MDNVINLNFIVKKIFSNKIFVLSITLTFAILFTSFSFLLPNKYSSQAVVRIPDIEGQEINQPLSSLGSIGSVVGVAGGSVADKSNIIIEILSSRDFVKSLIEPDESFLIDLFSINGFDKENFTSLYDENIYSPKAGWVKKPSGIYNERKPGYVEAHRLFRKSFTIFKDPKTGVIVLSFTHYSPIFAKEVIDSVILHINRTYKENELAKIEKRLDYLQEELISADLEVVRVSLSNMIETAMKEQTIATTSEQYALESIDNSFYPDFKSSPNRIFILIFSSFIGFIISVLYVVFFKKEI